MRLTSALTIFRQKPVVCFAAVNQPELYHPSKTVWSGHEPTLGSVDEFSWQKQHRSEDKMIFMCLSFVGITKPDGMFAPCGKKPIENVFLKAEADLGRLLGNQ